MARMLIALSVMLALAGTPVIAGDSEVKAAHGTIDSQLKAFLGDDPATAYSFAAPNVQRLFPTVEAFMGMVTSGYQPVYRPKTYAFGKVQELSATSIMQEVLIVGPDGKDYQAVYTLELQPDGVFRITGVSLRASNTLST